MANILKKSVSLVAALSMLSTSVPAFAATSIVDGDLVKAAGNSAVYLVQGSKLRTFPYSTIYHSWGFPSNYSTVKTVAASDLASYTIGDPIPFRDGSCFRGTAKSLPGFESEAVFCVSDGQLRPVESQNAFFGLFNVTNWTQGNKYVQFIPDDFLSKFDFAFGEKVTETEVNSGKIMNGLIVKGSVDGSYYLVQDGKLRALSTEAASANKFDLSKAITVAQTKVNAMTAALPVSTIVETALVTPKTKAEAQSAGTVTEVAQASKVIVSMDKTSVNADGITPVNVTAKIVTANGALVSTASNNVTFVVTNGTATITNYSVAAINGVATTRIIPSTTASTITVTAYVNGLTNGSASIVALANSEAPQIVSVSNQGMRIINVVFDRVVDKTTATNKANYIVKNNKTSQVTIEAAKLLDDNKTVQLFLNTGIYNDSTEDSIEVKNVKDASQKFTMSTVTRTLTILDSTIPTVTTAEALGSKAIRVTFSEAVKFYKDGIGYGFDKGYGYGNAAFRLDDKELITGNNPNANQIGNVTIIYPDAGDYTKALIEFANGITVGAHTLTAGYNGLIRDYNVLSSSTADNEFTMSAAGYVATVSAETSVPVLASVEVLSQTKVRYTFSKAISTPAAGAFYWSTSANQLSGISATSVEKVSDTVYDVSWGSNAISTGSIYFYAGTTVNRITDYSGNSISPLPSSKLLAVNSDTAPFISSVSMKTDSDKEVIISFDKEVDITGSVANTSNYVFKKANGTVLNSEDTNFVTSSGNPVVTPTISSNNAKEVVISGSESIPGGSYLLCITGIKASSGVYTSAMNEQCVSFTVTDKTQPDAIATADIIASAKRIVVKFSEPMELGSLLNAQNYKVKNVTGFNSENGQDVASLRKLSEVSGVTLSAKNDNKDLYIDFSYDNAVTSGSRIVVGYLDTDAVYAPKDVSGNFVRLAGEVTMPTLQTNKIFVGYGYGFTNSSYGYGYGITSAKITNATTLEVVFDREIEQISASDFQIKANGSEWVNISTATIDSTNKNKVTFTIPNVLGKVFKVTNTDTPISSVMRTVTTTPSSKDASGLTFVGMNTTNMNTSEAIALTAGNHSTLVTNDMKASLVAATVLSEVEILLSFDGKIGYGQTTDSAGRANLAKDLIVVINGETWGYGHTDNTSSYYVDPSYYDLDDVDSGSSNIKLKLKKNISLDSTVVVKTVSADAIRAVGCGTGAKINANTTGVTAASFAVKAATVLGYGTGNSAGYGYGYGLKLEFTRSLEPTSISTDTSFNVTSGIGLLLNRSVSYNASNSKMSISGIGEISGFTGTTSRSLNGVQYVYDATANTVTVW
ncbi:MAG: hypothetical protein K6E74_05740, partial [Bacilli bacterium]|nr:hypothetical protein [Bacilli bacterium]